MGGVTQPMMPQTGREPSLVQSGLGQLQQSQLQESQPQQGQPQQGPGGLKPGGRTMTGIPGTGSPMRWLFTAVWLVYLIQPVSSLFGHHYGPLYIAGALTITVAFSVIYVLTVGNTIKWPHLTRFGLAAIVVLAALACALYGKQWLALWIYVSSATGIALAGQTTRSRTLIAIAGIGACYTFFGWLTKDDPSDYLIVLLPVLLVGTAMLGFRMQIELMRELGQARETVAMMAANEERLRLARDMHDLTGQSLSMITLKSELAGKRLGRLPQTPETEAIHTELTDISRVSRQTLHDIREAVSGYRRPTLAIEFITARTALEAANVNLDGDPELITRSGAFDPEAEAVLAWCLREAVTNVIRHSGARNCVIRFSEHRGELCLEITDDGRGSGGSPGTGNGLRNMSERLSAVGGRLSLSPATDARGFQLTATVGVPA